MDFFESDDTELEECFDKASKHMASIATTLDSDTLLYFYARYKQATDGPCTVPKPGFFDLKGKQKWQAWKDLQEMSQEEAMEQYIDKLYDIAPDWQEDSKSLGRGRIAVSRPATVEGGEDPEIADADKSVFDWVKEDRLEPLKEKLRADESLLSSKDSNGLTLLHWAADRNHLAIARFLLSSGAPVNATDNEGQTALHFAASCDHVELTRLLLENGADRYLQDGDGCKPVELCSEAGTRQLFEACRQP